MSLSDIAILNIKGADYCCIISGFSKSEAINLMQNINLIQKSRTWENIKFYHHIQKWAKKFNVKRYWNWKKNSFYLRKRPIFLEDVDTEKLLVSNNISSGEKNYNYLIGYLYNGHKVKPLHIMLPKTSSYVKTCNGQTKWIYFFDRKLWLITKI